ncbi:MAG: response regulator transcription factor [Planctomycetales bacterium]|nr:response regulator transcription factor [Planctomycetales bacterium]
MSASARPTLGLLARRALLSEPLIERLRRDPRFRRARVLSGAREALALSRRGRLDLLLLELDGRAEEAFRLARDVSKLRRGPKVLAVAGGARIGWVQRSLAAGMAGFLGPSAGLDECLRAIGSLLRGQGYLSPCAAGIAADLAAGRGPGLTPREEEVLRLTCEGLSSKEIASALGITPKAVDSHRARLIQKTGAGSSTALVRYACEEGFCDLRSRGD